MDFTTRRSPSVLPSKGILPQFLAWPSPPFVLMDGETKVSTPRKLAPQWEKNARELGRGTVEPQPFQIPNQNLPPSVLEGKVEALQREARQPKPDFPQAQAASLENERRHAAMEKPTRTMGKVPFFLGPTDHTMQKVTRSLVER